MFEKIIHYWMVIGLVFIALFVISVLSLLALVWYENKTYPVCDKCLTNLHTKRNKNGKVICSVHGEINTT